MIAHDPFGELLADTGTKSANETDSTHTTYPEMMTSAHPSAIHRNRESSMWLRLRSVRPFATCQKPPAMIATAAKMLRIHTSLCVNSIAYPRRSERAMSQIAVPQIVAATKSKTIHADRERANVPMTWPRRKRTAAVPRMMRIVGRASPRLVQVRTTPPIPAIDAGNAMMANDTAISRSAAINFPNQIEAADTGLAK